MLILLNKYNMDNKSALETIIIERDLFVKQLEHETDPNRILVLKGQLSTYKVLLNSLYGIMVMN